jgi:hypothetical protein
VTKHLAVRSSLLASRVLGRLGGALCLLAAGCSLEVPGTRGSSAPIELDAQVGYEARLDAQAPTAALDAAPPAADAAVPVAEAGEKPSAGRDGGTPGTTPAGDADAGEATACSLQGRFALRFELDVTWPATTLLSVLPVIEAGAGELSFVMLMETRRNAKGFDARLRMCSAAVPESVRSVSGERYQLRFDDDVWDSDAMPVFSSWFEASCREPGCQLRGGPLVALVGAALGAPDAPWPADLGTGDWPDHDDDGELGITGDFLGPDDGSYAYPPLNLLAVTRMRELQLGLRVRAAFDGTLASCNEFGGPLAQGGIETRALGCASESESLCSSAELSALNENLPVWNAQQGRFEARLLPDDADCADARGAFQSRRSRGQDGARERPED